MRATTIPVMLNVHNRNLLVVGAGAIAQRKLKVLCGRGAKISVVAPEATSTICDWATRGECVWHKRKFRVSDLRGKALVFLATDDSRLNDHVAQLCARRGILSNVATAKNGDVLMMSYFEKDGLVVAVSSRGKNPARARVVRKQLQKTVLQKSIKRERK